MTTLAGLVADPDSDKDNYVKEGVVFIEWF